MKMSPIVPDFIILMWFHQNESDCPDFHQKRPKTPILAKNDQFYVKWHWEPILKNLIGAKLL